MGIKIRTLTTGLTKRFELNKDRTLVEKSGFGLDEPVLKIDNDEKTVRDTLGNVKFKIDGDIIRDESNLPVYKIEKDGTIWKVDPLFVSKTERVAKIEDWRRKKEEEKDEWRKRQQQEEIEKEELEQGREIDALSCDYSSCDRCSSFEECSGEEKQEEDS